MNKIRYIFLLIILLNVFGCKKKEDNSPIVPDTTSHVQIDTTVIDTIFPGNYFPAYPGSHWTYLTSDGDTNFHSTDSTYKIFSHYDPFYNENDSSLYYAPLYDGSIVKKYLISNGPINRWTNGWIRILPESIYVSVLYEEYEYRPTFLQYGQIWTIDTSMNINSFHFDSVLVVTELSGPSGTEIVIGKTYYAKNVGIVKKERMNYIGTISYEENIIDFFVNH